MHNIEDKNHSSDVTGNSSYLRTGDGVLSFFLNKDKDEALDLLRAVAGLHGYAVVPYEQLTKSEVSTARAGSRKAPKKKTKSRKPKRAKGQSSGAKNTPKPGVSWSDQTEDQKKTAPPQNEEAQPSCLPDKAGSDLKSVQEFPPDYPEGAPRDKNGLANFKKGLKWGGSSWVEKPRDPNMFHLEDAAKLFGFRPLHGHAHLFFLEDCKQPPKNRRVTSNLRTAKNGYLDYITGSLRQEYNPDHDPDAQEVSALRGFIYAYVRREYFYPTHSLEKGGVVSDINSSTLNPLLSLLQEDPPDAKKLAEAYLSIDWQQAALRSRQLISKIPSVLKKLEKT